MKNVLIEIKGTQNVEGEEQDVIEMMTEGSLDVSDSGLVLKYTEQDEEIGVVDTTVSVEESEDGKIVTLDKFGRDDSRMTIQRGHRHMSLYNVGPCEFTIGVFGEKVLCELDEHGGRLKLRYTIDINSAFAGRNEVDITVREISES